MKINRLAASVATGAALAISGVTAAPAFATNWDYTGQDFFWQEDCIDEGQDMLTEGWITKYKCDGSESPFDDYSLFVVWAR